MQGITPDQAANIAGTSDMHRRTNIAPDIAGTSDMHRCTNNTDVCRQVCACNYTKWAVTKRCAQIMIDAHGVFGGSTRI